MSSPNHNAEQDRPPYPKRKALRHVPPLSVDAADAFYFVTVCAADRDGTALAGRADAILSAARHYHETGKWFLSLLLVMPDHIHMLVHVPTVFSGRAVCPKPPQSYSNDAPLCRDCGGVGQTALPNGAHIGGVGHTALPKYRTALEHVIGEWKRYLSRTAHIRFQRDFFDTRIRNDAHYAEKWNYIVRNSVARGLVAAPGEWPYAIGIAARKVWIGRP